MARPSRNLSESAAANRLVDLFRANGWHVAAGPVAEGRADLVVGKDKLRYVLEIKSAGEGRPDRVLPLLSQAILVARRHAELRGMRPLGVVLVNDASPSLFEKVARFRRDYASDAAIGVVSEGGASLFIGDRELEALSIDLLRSGGRKKAVRPRRASDLFSDLNQWMLKVLLAPEFPEKLLNAPRGEYRSVSALAEAAQVSAMSASRFARRLQEDGFLDDAGHSLRLVRRRELFRRWRSSAARSSPELRMSFLLPGAAARQLHKAASQLDGCIGLFAAADLLHVGHVSGMAPYLYVRHLSSSQEWPGLVPSRAGEPAQIILKQSNVPQSLFRGAVDVDGVRVSDVLQIWLDVSAHPSRGAEQADFIENKILASVLGKSE
jgi:hypothetical protein